MVTILLSVWKTKPVPEFEPEIIPNQSNSVGIDLGLEKLYVDSNGNQVLPQKHYRKLEAKLANLQKRKADKSIGKKIKRLIQKKISKLHQKIARQRKQCHYEIAKQLCSIADVIFVEDLNIANLKRKNKPKKINNRYVPNGQSAKSGLNKSFSDCAIGQFVDILNQQAKKVGCKIIKVNPKGTSQHCHNCLNKVPKTLSDRWHDCSHCGESIDRDYNSALLIKKVGLGISLTIKRQ